MNSQRVKTWLKRSAWAALALVVMALAAQVFWTDWCLRHCRAQNTADAVVVFTGDVDRIRTAVRLTRESSAKYLLVSRDQRRLVEGIVKREGGLNGATLFVDDSYAWTTDGNARYAAPLLRDLSVQEALLVTDWYHLPRSLFLLKWYLGFSPVNVRPYPAQGISDRPWEEPQLQAEFFKFWGSLLRLGLYEVGVAAQRQRVVEAKMKCMSYLITP
jgi:uncharacterized SAM-binding protein YcdF (DUF218 family)